MTKNKHLYAILSVQGLLFIGLVIVFIYIYELDQKNRQMASLLENNDKAFFSAHIDADDVQHTSKKDANVNTQELLPRLRIIEEKIADLTKIVAENTRKNNLKTDAAFSTVKKLDQAELQRLKASNDLAARHSQESTISAWGQAANDAINRLYTESENSSSSFFSRYNGNLTTDCRGSVCNLTWSPNTLGSASLTDEEKVNFIETARMELIGLAGSSQNAGQIKSVVDNSEDPPSISVFVDQSGGNEPIPSHISEYKKGDHE